MADFMRNGFRDSVRQAISDVGHLIVRGSAGQGVWARGPWVGIFDPLITTTAQNGYYPVYLFREDMQGVYLSLNQGMTEAKGLYKSDAKTALRARALNYRAMLGRQTGTFTDFEVELAPSKPSNDTAFYEAGNVCAKFYAIHRLPVEDELVHDLHEMLAVYRALLEAETSSHAGSSDEGDEPPGLHFEDATKFRMHKRIERNGKLVKAVKSAQGHTCKVCETDFESRYGDIGKGYIEAHHLRPVASLKGTKVPMDPLLDFVVLCSNCHRMVHRSKCIGDMEKFRKEHYKA